MERSGGSSRWPSVLERWAEPIYDEAGWDMAFRRGDAVIRLRVTDGSVIGLPEDPFAHLDLTLDKVQAALVPLAELPPGHLEPPPSYLNQEIWAGE